MKVWKFMVAIVLSNLAIEAIVKTIKDFSTHGFWTLMSWAPKDYPVGYTQTDAGIDAVGSVLLLALLTIIIWELFKKQFNKNIDF